MSEHTPGPWYVRSLGQHWNNAQLEHLEVCYGKDDECVCDTVYQKADAHLIAAAPDLLQALKAFAEDWSELGGKIRGSTLDKIDAAIAKAEARRG